LGVEGSNGMWYRTTQGTIVGAAWKRVLDSSNYNSYALPLAGGTMNTDAYINIYNNSGNLGASYVKIYDNSNYGASMYAENILLWSGAADYPEATDITEIWAHYIYTSGYLQTGTSLTVGTTATIGTTLTVKSNAYFKAATNYFYNGSNYTAINRPSASANYTLYLPSATGQLVYHTNDTAIGGSAKPVYIAASGAATACRSTVGSTSKPVYMNAGTITALSATVGSANRPVYMNAGTITALTSVSTAYGGTGVTSHTANRLVWSSSATAIQAANHYANSTKVAINYTSAPTENFYVNGTSKFTNTVNLNAENNVCINFRPGLATYYTTISHQTSGNEALVFATKNAVTSFMFVNGEDSVTNHAGDRWKSITPALQIKKNCVYIGSLIADGTDPAYKFYVGGNMSISGGIIRNGVSTSWIQGRANALIRTNTLSGYSPTMTVKTNNGSWDIGAYDYAAYADELVFSFCKDTDFNSNNNAVTQQCRLRIGYGGYFVMTGNFVLNGTTLAITM
ncbi:MAG: hypothetical protein IJ272_03565, partial [Clostridia bacterium]|nr:hypothetical protein [Clostridia bacterium]